MKIKGIWVDIVILSFGFSLLAIAGTIQLVEANEPFTSIRGFLLSACATFPFSKAIERHKKRRAISKLFESELGQSAIKFLVEQKNFSLPEANTLVFSICLSNAGELGVEILEAIVNDDANLVAQKMSELISFDPNVHIFRNF